MKHLKVKKVYLKADASQYNIDLAKDNIQNNFVNNINTLWITYKC